MYTKFIILIFCAVPIDTDVHQIIYINSIIIMLCLLTLMYTKLIILIVYALPIDTDVHQINYINSICSAY